MAAMSESSHLLEDGHVPGSEPGDVENDAHRSGMRCTPRAAAALLAAAAAVLAVTSVLALAGLGHVPALQSRGHSISAQAVKALQIKDTEEPGREGEGENDKEGEAQAAEPALVKELTAYWDGGACGPFGDDHQADLCGGLTAVATCPERIGVSPTVCPSGVAELLRVRGRGGPVYQKSVELGGCAYDWLAQWVCVEGNVSRQVLPAPDCTKGRDDCYEYTDETTCSGAKGRPEDAAPGFPSCTWCGDGRCMNDGNSCQRNWWLLDGDGSDYTGRAARDRYAETMCDGAQTDLVDFEQAKLVAAVPPPVELQSKVKLFGFDNRVGAVWFPMKGFRRRWVHNMGVGQSWVGKFATKLHAVRTALAAEAVRDPDQMVIVLDTEDMWDGGCTDNELLERYHRIVAASGGAPVVHGVDGEMCCPEFGIPDRQEFHRVFDERQRSVMKEFNVSYDDLLPYTTLTGEFFYANGGFVMGPAGKVLDWVSCSLHEGFEVSPFDDQRGYNRCAMHSPGKVTFDWATSIVMTTLLWSKNWLYVDDGVVRSQVTGMTQCFIHGTGLGHNPYRQFMYDLTRDLQAALPAELVPELTAYWDDGTCGPLGDDHQADLCGGPNNETVACPDRIDVPSTVCPSGVAGLRKLFGHGGTDFSNHFMYQGCAYAWLADYRCIAAEGQ